MEASFTLGGSDYDNESASDDNYEEIESLLDQALPDELKNKKREYEERFKVVMEGRVVILLVFTFLLVVFHQRKVAIILKFCLRAGFKLPTIAECLCICSDTQESARCLGHIFSVRDQSVNMRFP